jgi:hypothetical protein
MVPIVAEANGFNRSTLQRRCGATKKKSERATSRKDREERKNFFALALRFDDRSRILSSQPHLQSRAEKKRQT